MTFTTLQFCREGAVGILTIDRPQAMNALNAQVLNELKVFLKEVRAEKDLRCLVLTGAGEKAFVAGADIKEMNAIDLSQSAAFAENGQGVFQMIEDLPMPVIAAVNGFALGGGLELAMACDFILAAKTAKLGLPEVSLGLIPGYGGTQRLARYCGKGIARLMALTGDIFSAEQCAAWGLVALVVEPQDLMPTALKMANTVAKRSPKAVALAKSAVNRGFDVSQSEGMEIEAKSFYEVFNSEDKKEGVQAFIEKRTPNFSGK